MRVLYSFPDTLGAAGIGTTALEQVRSLARLGVDVHVAATSLAADPGVPCTVTLAPAGCRVPHGALGRDHAGALRAYAWHDRRVAAMIRRGAGLDAVHCWPQATLRTAHVASQLGIAVLRQAPSTHTAHAVRTVAALHAELGMPMRVDDFHGHSPALVAREEAEYEAADLVLAPSPYAASTFARRGFPAERVWVHRFGCDLDRFRPAAGEPDPERPLTFLFAARGEPAKGLHHALRAWAASGVATDSARLVLCGRIDADFRRHLGALLDDPSIEERGFTTDLATVMREADVMLLPSRNEGSALVTYEAQATGCVLAVSDATGAPAQHLVHGLVHRAGDEAALADHLRRLATERALLPDLRRRVLMDRERLAWDAAAGGLAGAYRAAIAGRELRRAA
jgi:glycosyltransferase involved in cell wall biosynthesis